MQSNDCSLLHVSDKEIRDMQQTEDSHREEGWEEINHLCVSFKNSPFTIIHSSFTRKSRHQDKHMLFAKMHQPPIESNWRAGAAE